MWQAIRPAFPVLIAIMLIEAGLGLLSPVIGIQLEARGITPLLVGMTASVYSVGFLWGSLRGHKIIDRVGHIRAFSVFAVIAADAILLHIVFHQPFAWLIFRAAQGYAIAGSYLVIESWLNDKAQPATRGRIFAIYTAISWGVSGLSPLSFNIADPKGPLLFIAAAMFMATSLISMSMTRIGNPEIAQRRHFGLMQLFKISPLAVACCFGAGFLNGGLYALLPIYTGSIGLSEQKLATLISMSSIAALIGQFPIGHLADHYGRRPIIIITMTIAAVFAFALFAMAKAPFLLLLGLFFLMTTVESPIYALGVGQMTDYVEKKDFVAASSGLLFAWGFGAAIGPSISGTIMAILGGRALFLVLSLGFASIAAFAIYRLQRRTAKDAEAQSNYVAQPVPLFQGTSTGGAPELDPRRE